MTSCTWSISKAAQQGFSFIEVLVVVVIAALLATTISLTSNPSERLQEEAKRIVALQEQLASEAVFSGKPMVMFIDHGGYHFEKRIHGEWQVLDKRPFSSRTIESPLTLAAPGGCTVAKKRPLKDPIRILMLPDGQRTPFHLELCDSDTTINIKGRLSDAVLEVLSTS